MLEEPDQKEEEKEKEEVAVTFKFCRDFKKQFKEVRKNLKLFFSGIGEVKRIFSVHPFCWALITNKNDAQKFLGLKNLGEHFTGAQFTTRLQPELTRAQKVEKRKRKFKNNRQNKRARLAAAEAGQSSNSKDVEIEVLKRQMADLKRENVELRDEKILADRKVDILEFKVESSTGKKVQYDEKDQWLLRRKE